MTTIEILESVGVQLSNEDKELLVAIQDAEKREIIISILKGF